MGCSYTVAATPCVSADRRAPSGLLLSAERVAARACCRDLGGAGSKQGSTQRFHYVCCSSTRDPSCGCKLLADLQDIKTFGFRSCRTEHTAVHLIYPYDFMTGARLGPLAAQR